jgi:oxygen-independent coproporphyrinogen-3 oxidase
MEELVQKYNVAAPRYTSYPTVPFWDNEAFSRAAWTNQVYQTFQQSKKKVSAYIYTFLFVKASVRIVAAIRALQKPSR